MRKSPAAVPAVPLGDTLKRYYQLVGDDAYYLTAQRARTRIRREYEAAFARCDVMLLPPAPTLAPVMPLTCAVSPPVARYQSLRCS